MQEPKSYIQMYMPSFLYTVCDLLFFKPKETNQSEFEAINSGMSLCLEVNNLEEAIAHLNSLGYPPPKYFNSVSR